MRDPAAILAGLDAETLIAGLEGPDESGFGSLPDQPAPWWSFTKTVLAAAALALVRDGRLSLDSTQGRPFSLRQLLQHTAGLPDYGGLEDYKAAVARNDEPWPPEEMLARADAATLLFPPGQGWSYSNIGYLLVGRILEEATSESLADALRHLVFDPLDLKGVRLAQVRAALDDTAWGNARRYHPGWVYHGLLVGSPREAARLLHRLFLWDFLPHDLRRAMLDLHVVGEPIPGRPFRQPGYGLGVMGDSGRPEPIFGHTGQGPGSTCAVYQAGSGRRVCTVAVFRPADGPAVQATLEELSFELLESPSPWAGLQAS
jgi:CubicO group peptidase (beta-lactamase class C family)